MRKITFASLAMTFLLLSGVTAANALAKPVGPAPVQFAVDGTFSSGPGVPGTPFQGTVTVARFVEQDGQLAVHGTLAGTETSVDALAVTVIANATASDDTGSGCTVQIDTVSAFIDAGVIIFLTGAGFTLSETNEPDSARELCRVVQTAAKDSSDQSALARALNRLLRA
ncbi:hypothetical protein AB0M20_19700 [Actinoplanes sp. NPDC051633]|uniref:hypothetical protein n=1 Tax=Actinoplanes sp. NPDC051633 TaxID=3155670 RepID=UPI0034484913